MATTSFSNQIAEQPLLINLVIDGKITPKSESIDTLHTIRGEIKSAPDTILLFSSPYYFQFKHGEFSSKVDQGIGNELQSRTRVTRTLNLPSSQTFLGVLQTCSCPTNVFWNKRLNSFPIVRKYQLELTCWLSENQSVLLKSNCWQAKHGVQARYRVWYVTKQFCSGQEGRRQGLAFCIFPLCTTWRRVC